MKTHVFNRLIVATWLAVTLSGTWLMLAYANTPGATGAAPAQWPKMSAMLPSPTQPTLMMFVHSQCPCSRASIGELALLMARNGQRVDARVIFLDSADSDPAATPSDLWTAAEAIPGVKVAGDPEGREAGWFAAATSGETLLYDKTGRLLFHGGITVARGHSGDNAGRSALEALLDGELRQAGTPVFGCPLFGEKEAATCPR